MESLKYIQGWFSNLTYAQGLSIILIIGIAVLLVLLAKFLERKDKQFTEYIANRDKQFGQYEEGYREERRRKDEAAERARIHDNSTREKLADSLNEMATAIKINTERLNK